ncbi:ECF transporter S component [Intestinibacter sp.]|uniref:ECF transporter S component n=1 Tax=Intestinibacter sp. TaxID=1965304 RepID=UPI002A7636AE|nr:ECF transporter S component [Intestinibacter sp.]MDY2735344.1 ECF transporter S component [Intestinibacter sp.]
MKTNVQKLTIAAIMGTISFILIYLGFSIPILSAFAELDLSALPELIGGFILGPVGAVEIIVIKLVLKLAFDGTTSAFTGELQNLILSLAYVLPSVIYYQKHKTKKGAIIGILIGSILSIIIAIFTNIYLIFPAFMYLYGMNWDIIIETCSKINPYIKDIPTFVIFSVIPFNIVSRAITSVLTFLIYKRLSVPLKKFMAA